MSTLVRSSNTVSPPAVTTMPEDATCPCTAWRAGRTCQLYVPVGGSTTGAPVSTTELEKRAVVEEGRTVRPPVTVAPPERTAMPPLLTVVKPSPRMSNNLVLLVPTSTNRKSLAVNSTGRRRYTCAQQAQSCKNQRAAVSLVWFAQQTSGTMTEKPPEKRGRLGPFAFVDVS